MMSASRSAPFDKDGVTNQLVARVKSLISAGVLRPGARLPPERELAPAFGVSRSSLRHALKALEIMGVLTQRVGDGTYLASDAGAILREPFELLMLIDGITLDDLLETRLIVEPELAARAAERATLEDLRKMGQTLETHKRGVDDSVLVEADLAFHRAVFEAARNPICSRLFSLIHRAMAGSIELTTHMVDWDHTLSFHRPIYEAIERRRPADARVAMIAHLSDAKSLLSKLEEKAKRIDTSLIAARGGLMKRAGGRKK